MMKMLKGDKEIIFKSQSIEALQITANKQDEISRKAERDKRDEESTQHHVELTSKLKVFHRMCLEKDKQISQLKKENKDYLDKRNAVYEQFRKAVSEIEILKKEIERIKLLAEKDRNQWIKEHKENEELKKEILNCNNLFEFRILRQNLKEKRK